MRALRSPATGLLGQGVAVQLRRRRRYRRSAFASIRPRTGLAAFIYQKPSTRVDEELDKFGEIIGVTHSDWRFWRRARDLGDRAHNVLVLPSRHRTPPLRFRSMISGVCSASHEILTHPLPRGTGRWVSSLRVRRLRLRVRSILARWLGGLLRFLGSVPLVLSPTTAGLTEHAVIDDSVRRGSPHQ
jgi:hypothetical protein